MKKLLLIICSLAMTVPALAKDDPATKGEYDLLCGAKDEKEPPFEIVKDAPPPPHLADGQSRVYFIRRDFTIVSTVRTYADGRLLGATRKHNYFFVDLPAGQHRFCASGRVKMAGRALLGLDLQPGQSYYVSQDMVRGLSLSELNAEEGRSQVAKSKLTRLTAKK